MPDLEDEESAPQEKQVAKGLKILTPNQTFNRLPISLALLKAENDSENLKMKLGNYRILCTDKKKTYRATLQKFHWHYLKIETIFINSENSKTNEACSFRLDLTGKFDLKEKHGLSQFEYLLHLEKHQIRIQQQ